MQQLDWGTINYQEALQQQILLAENLKKKQAKESIVLCSHPPVVTLGKQARPQDVLGWPGEIVEVTRGGKATYHGPSQLIAYPIIDISKRNFDLHAYLRGLEKAICRTLAHYQITAVGNVEATGVWVGNKKIASIGIAVKRWITYHGLALNVTYDPKAFQGISPCGFSTETMISVEQLIGEKINRSELKHYLFSYLRDEIQQLKDTPNL